MNILLVYSSEASRKDWPVLISVLSLSGAVNTYMHTYIHSYMHACIKVNIT